MDEFTDIDDDWLPNKDTFTYLIRSCPGITMPKLHIFRLNCVDVINANLVAPSIRDQAFINFVESLWKDGDHEPILNRPRENIGFGPGAKVQPSKNDITDIERDLADRSWAYTETANNNDQTGWLCDPSKKHLFPNRSIADVRSGKKWTPAEWDNNPHDGDIVDEQ